MFIDTGDNMKTLRGQRNQCPTCNEYFNSNLAFSKHRHGDFGADRRCMTVEEMQAKGMALNSAGFWVTALMPKTLTAKAIDDDTPEWEPDSIEREEGGGAIWRLQNGDWD